MSDIASTQNESIQFEGNQSSRKVAIELLDKVLKEQGDLGSYGDLSGGIAQVTRDMNINITEADEYYAIDLYPGSNSGGHDFGFTIDKISGKRSEVTVGEILPQPEFED